MVAPSIVSNPFISSLFMTFVQFEICPHHGGLFASLRVPDKLTSVIYPAVWVYIPSGLGLLGDTSLWDISATEESPVPPQSPEAVFIALVTNE